MMMLREEAFAVVYRAGSVKLVTITIDDEGSFISYELGDGSAGVIHTKRGVPKRYRLDTAARFLRSLGLAKATLDMHGWSIDQQALAL